MSEQITITVSGEGLETRTVTGNVAFIVVGDAAFTTNGHGARDKITLANRNTFVWGDAVAVGVSLAQFIQRMRKDEPAVFAVMGAACMRDYERELADACTPKEGS